MRAPLFRFLSCLDVRSLDHNFLCVFLYLAVKDFGSTCTHGKRGKVFLYRSFPQLNPSVRVPTSTAKNDDGKGFLALVE